MVTKLKNLTKKQRELTLGGSWVLLLAFLSLAALHNRYGQSGYWYGAVTRNRFQIAGGVEAIIGIFAGVLLVSATRKHFKTFPLKDIKKCKMDGWKLEWILLFEFLMLFLWSWGVMWEWDNPYVFTIFFFGYRVTSIYTVVKYVLTQIVLAAGILAGIILLVRRLLLKNWKETSLIYQEIQGYKKRTSLEKRIADYSKRTLLVFLAFTVLQIFLGVAVYTNFIGKRFYLLAMGLGVLEMLLALGYFRRNRIYHDAIVLAGQIDAMTEGGEISENLMLPSESLFAASMEKLFGIEEAMKKSMAKQVQAERLKIELITNVSHDLKTPLTSMIGYADLLKKEELSAQARDYVDAISTKQEQLKDMIQDLFELAKANSRTEELELETLDMKTLARQILADMEDAIAGSSCTFRQVFTEKETWFVGDNRKMYRVVQNLIENALKYSMEGTRVYVNVEQENHQVLLSIKNISASEMNFSPEEIVERFNRGDQSRTTEGHGLGLAIASSFTQNMGGEMKVEIDGDLFKVTLCFPEAKQFSNKLGSL